MRQGWWWAGLAASVMTFGAGVQAAEGEPSEGRITDWVSVGVEGGVEHFVDPNALLRNGEVVRVAKRTVFLEPHPMGDTPGMPLVRETIGVIEDDCDRIQHRAVSMRVIGIDGQVLWSSGEMRRVWEVIQPGSGGRATLDFACARTAP